MANLSDFVSAQKDSRLLGSVENTIKTVLRPVEAYYKAKKEPHLQTLEAVDSQGESVSANIEARLAAIRETLKRMYCTKRFGLKPEELDAFIDANIEEFGQTQSFGMRQF